MNPWLEACEDYRIVVLSDGRTVHIAYRKGCNYVVSTVTQGRAVTYWIGYTSVETVLSEYVQEWKKEGLTWHITEPFVITDYQSLV